MQAPQQLLACLLGLPHQLLSWKPKASWSKGSGLKILSKKWPRLQHQNVILPTFLSDDVGDYDDIFVFWCWNFGKLPSLPRDFICQQGNFLQPYGWKCLHLDRGVGECWAESLRRPSRERWAARYLKTIFCKDCDKEISREDNIVTIIMTTVNMIIRVAFSLHRSDELFLVPNHPPLCHSRF